MSSYRGQSDSYPCSSNSLHVFLCLYSHAFTLYCSLYRGFIIIYIYIYRGSNLLNKTYTNNCLEINSYSTAAYYCYFLCTQKVRTLQNRSVCPAGRPSVYTITLQRLIRLSRNFVHRTVSLISRSSSKMRTIGLHLPGLQQKM